MGDLEASIFGVGVPEVAEVSFDVDFALQGQAAEALVRSAVAAGRPYAMAFVDMRMPPGWDGLQTIEALWRVDPALEVVICTAYSDHTELEIVARLGVSDQLLFLRKPFEPIEVRLLARTLTEKWTLRHQAIARQAELERRVATRTRELVAASVHRATDAAPASPTTIDLADALRDVVDKMRDGINACARLETDFGVVPPVPCTSADIKLVLTGLVDSAIQAIEGSDRPSGATGHIAISTRSDQGDAVVTITDDGETVSEAMRAHIFEPFFAAGARRGLAVVRNVIVDKHGGKLTIEGAAGGGATVCVRLPLARVAPRGEAAAESLLGVSDGA